MGDPLPVPYDDAGCAVRDAGDVLLVIGMVLATQPGELTAKMQEALATLARLGECRAEAAAMLLDKAEGGARG